MFWRNRIGSAAPSGRHSGRWGRVDPDRFSEILDGNGFPWVSYMKMMKPSQTGGSSSSTSFICQPFQLNGLCSAISIVPSWPRRPPSGLTWVAGLFCFELTVFGGSQEVFLLHFWRLTKKTNLWFLFPRNWLFEDVLQLFWEQTTPWKLAGGSERAFQLPEIEGTTYSCVGVWKCLGPVWDDLYGLAQNKVDRCW